MKPTFVFKRSLIGAAALLGLAAQSHALPTFTINPTATGAGGAIFSADALSFTNSSELITLSANAGSAAGTGTGSGWANIGSYSLAGNQTAAVGFGAGYQSYITFDLDVALTSGLLGQAGSTYAITKLDFKWWSSLGDADNTFIQATNAGAAGTAATVNTGATVDKLLAFGSLVSGVADLNAQGGTGLNAFNSFAVCTGAGTADFSGVAVPNGGTPFMNATAASCVDGAGDAYFDTPNPFYGLVFSTFSNTSQGISLSSNLRGLAINAAGRADFLQVPEPGSLALVSLALLGAGATLRKRKGA